MNVLKRIKKQIVLGLVNSVFQGTHAFGIKRTLLNCCEGIQIGMGTKIVTPIHVPGVGSLEIGENCWIGRDFSLEGNGKVHIGSNCDLAPAIVCVTGSHEIGDYNRRAGEGYNSGIGIGDGSWLGTRTIILPGIDIGKAVVIGAGSVVTKNLAEGSVYVGNPAKLMRKL